MTSASLSKAETLTLSSDSWCPYTCVAGSSKEGFIIDIVRRVFEPKGYQVEYQMIPWTRSLKMTQNYPYHLSPGASNQEGEGLVFPKEIVGQAVNAFVTKYDDDWVYGDVSSLKSRKLGAVKGYSYSPEIDQFIADNPDNIHWLHGDDPVSTGLKMLVAGHIDALIEDRNVLIETATAADKLQYIRFAGELSSGTDLYVAFSPSKPIGQELANLLSEEIVLLRKSGELAKILDRYGLKDWK